MHDLDEYALKAYMSKDDIGKKAFRFIQKAIDIRHEELDLIKDTSAFAVDSEVSADYDE